MLTIPRNGSGSAQPTVDNAHVGASLCQSPEASPCSRPRTPTPPRGCQPVPVSGRTPHATNTTAGPAAPRSPCQLPRRRRNSHDSAESIRRAADRGQRPRGCQLMPVSGCTLHATNTGRRPGRRRSIDAGWYLGTWFVRAGTCLRDSNPNKISACWEHPRRVQGCERAVRVSLVLLDVCHDAAPRRHPISRCGLLVQATVRGTGTRPGRAGTEERAEDSESSSMAPPRVRGRTSRAPRR